MTSPGDTALTTLLLSALNHGLPGDTVANTTTSIVKTQVKSLEKKPQYSCDPSQAFIPGFSVFLVYDGYICLFKDA